MKLFLRNYLLLVLLSLLTLFSCADKSTTDSNNPLTTPPITSLSIDYGISEGFYIALTNTALELIQKENFGSQSRFSVSPSLPSGLSLDITNGNIKGNPTNYNRPTTYTVTTTKDGKTYTKVISLGVAPSITWVTRTNLDNPYQLTAYVVGDGAKQIDDWTWGSSDENLLTVVNGLVNPSTTATRGNSTVIIYAKKDISAGSAQSSYSNGISIAVQDLGNGKTITIGTSIHLIINGGTTTVTNNQFRNKGLTSLTIPNSVTNIGDHAFRDNQLTKVVIPNSIKHIGDAAFFRNKLSSVTILNSVTNIGDSAFQNNQLTSLVIPNSVTSIGPNAFSYNQLTSVVIPNSVTSIDNYAFQNNQLTSLFIPNGVTYIGDYAFYNNQLTHVIIPNGVTYIGDYAFYNNQLTHVIIPNSVTNIRSFTFGYNQLTSVTIPNNVTNIGGSAFGYNQLTSVTIPNSVTYIGGSAFLNNKLTSIIIPNSVTYIDNLAFKNNQLTRVVIPDSVTNIDNQAFFGNTNLVEVSLKQGLYTKITNTSSTNAVFGTQVANYIKRP